MLMRRFLFVYSMLSLTGSMAYAQKIYTHVEQNNAELEKLGTAAFDVNANSHPTVVFENGKALMTINNVKVATLPMSDNGELVVDVETTKEETALNKVTKIPSEKAPYVTIYSPFQLKVPAVGEVYAPEYDATSNVVRLNSKTQVEAGAIVPVETPLTVCGTTDNVDFEISVSQSTCTKISALSGSSLTISKPSDGGTIFTYGIGAEGKHKGEYGLFKYTGTTLGAGLAYLQTTNTAASGAKFVALSFDDVTGIDNVQNVQKVSAVGKFVENGRLVIKKNGKMFNVSGQEVK